MKAAPIAPGALRATLSRASSRPVRSSWPGGGSLRPAGGTAHGELVDVGEGGELVDQRVAGEERGLPKDREVGPRPPAWNEVPRGVRVAASLAADGEVEERAGLRCRLADVTARAGGGLFGGEDATELRQNSGRADRVVKQLLPEVPLGLGDLEERVRAAIGQPRLRQVGIVRRHHQLLDAADLLIDESAQLRRAAALRGGDGAAQEREGNGQCHAEGTAAGTLCVPHIRASKGD